MVLLSDRANIGDPRHQVVENGCGDKRRNEGGKHLAVEGDPRWNVGVMSEFEVLGEMEGVRGGDVPVALEVEHGSGVAREPETAEQLGEDVEGYLYVRDGHDDAARNAEDGGHEDTIQRGGGGGVGGVSGDASRTETDGNTQDDRVYPLRNLFVRPHQAGVDVPGMIEGRFTTDQVFEPGNNLATVIQSDVSDGSSIGCKIDAVEEAVPGGQTRDTTSTKSNRKGSEDVIRDGRLGLIGSFVEYGLVVDDLPDFIIPASVVEHTVGVDREMASVPSIGEPDRSNDGEGEESTKEDL